MSIFRRKNRPHQPSRQKLDAAISTILDQAINVDSDKAPEHLRIVLMKENPLWKLTERRVARYLKRHLKARQNPIAEQIDADMDEQTVYTTISNNTTNTAKEVAVAPPIVNNKSIPEDGTPEADTPATTPTAAGMSGGDEGTATDSNTDTDVTKDTTDENVESSEKTTEEVVETATDAAAKEEGGEEEEEEVKVTKADDAADADVAVKSGDDTEAADAETETKDDSVPTEVVNVAGQRDVTEDYSDDNDGEAEGLVCFGASCVIS